MFIHSAMCNAKFITDHGVDKVGEFKQSTWHYLVQYIFYDGF